MTEREREQGTALAVVQEKMRGMRAQLAEITVTDDQSLAKVSDWVKLVKQLGKYIEQEKDKYVAPAKAIIEKAREQYDPMIAECKEAERTLKSKAQQFMEAREAERTRAAAKIEARVEKGTMRVDTAIRKMEELPVSAKRVETEGGSQLQMQRRPVAKVTDPTLVPDEYWIIDEVRVRREAIERYKKGEPQVPGVEVVLEASIASR